MKIQTIQTNKQKENVETTKIQKQIKVTNTKRKVNIEKHPDIEHVIINTDIEQ